MIRFPMQSKVKTVVPRTKESRVRTIFRPHEPIPPAPAPVAEPVVEPVEDIPVAEGESPDISPLAVSVTPEQLAIDAKVDAP